MANIKISDLPLIDNLPQISGSVFPIVRNNVTYKMDWEQLETTITASNALNGFPYTGSALITGSLGITGSLDTTGDATFSGALNGTTAAFTSASGAHIGVTSEVTDAEGSSRLRAKSTGNNVTDLTSYSASHPSRANQAWIGGDGASTTTVIQSGGVASLTIASGGNVGIGTSNPSSGVGTTSTGTLLDVYDGTVIGNNGGALVLSGLGNASRKLNLGQIRTILTNGTVGVETSDMTFSTMSAATLTERLRISSGGTVTVSGPGIDIDRPSTSSGEPFLQFKKEGVVRSSIYAANGAAGLRFFLSGGAATFDSTVSATQFSSESNSISLPNNTATTIFTSTGAGGVWIVTYTIDGNGSQAGFAIVGNARAGTLYIFSSGVGSQTSLSVSGLSLQLTHTAGGDLPCKFSAIKLNSL